MNLTDKPTHGSVKRVKRIEVDWLTRQIGWKGIQEISKQKSTMGDLKETIFAERPDLLLEFMDLQTSIGEYQTIMLATGWTLKEMLDFTEEAPEDDYQDLLKRCIETLGGTAADFFGISGSGSPSQEEAPEEIPKKKPSKKS